MKKIITEKFDREGKLIERITEETNDNIFDEIQKNYPSLRELQKNIKLQPTVTLCYGCNPTLTTTVSTQWQKGIMSKFCKIE